MARKLAGRTTAEKLAMNSRRDGDCLRWTGAHTRTGYGYVTISRARNRVHRLAYELAHGPIPEGLEIDHVHSRGCRFRDCIEPDHLEAVTHQENIRRAFLTGIPHNRAPQRVFVCPQGHEKSGENLLRYNGRLQCRECKKDGNRRRPSRAGKGPKMPDKAWHGWSRGAANLYIGQLPHRSSVALYTVTGVEVHVLAYFRAEQDARQALELLDRILPVTVTDGKSDGVGDRPVLGGAR